MVVEIRLNIYSKEWIGCCTSLGNLSIDDIIVRLSSFDEHIYHLRQNFQLFVDYNISIKPSKTFLGSESIDFLGQQVNTVGLASSKFILEAIAKIEFLSTLSELETYLGMTRYLQKFVLFYASDAKLL